MKAIYSITHKHHHRIAIWNKASSHLQSSFPGFPIIKQSILNSKANLIILSEANITEENIKNINGEFPDFDIHRKYIPGSKLSRIAVMTKNQGLNIQRMESIEDPSTACILVQNETSGKNNNDSCLVQTMEPISRCSPKLH